MRLLDERLELVEDLWQTVLRSECPPQQAERLLRMKEISCAVDGLPGDAASAEATERSTAEIIQVIREMDLAEAIAAARAFSLYFQLVNILEQHIEEDSYLASLRAHHPEDLNDPFVPPLASQTEPATFRPLRSSSYWWSSTSGWCSPPTPPRSCAIPCATSSAVWRP
jgi:phosphoenolpyruvate carboxylase